MKHFVISCCLFLASAALVHADNWPQWRGPENTGVSKESNPLPASWDLQKNMAWKLTMPGIGGSTPCIWGDRMFLTSGEGKSLVLLCLKTDGSQLWKKTFAGNDRMIRKDEGNEASASPSSDGKHVWVFVGTGDLACFDFQGNEIWHKNLQEEYGRFSIQHGMHSTPVLHGDRLYLNLLHGNANLVLAIDKATGKNVWKVNRKSDARGESKEAYTSPSIANNGAEDYLVVHGADYTTGHRLSNGEEIWRLGDLNPTGNTAYRIISSPIVSKDLIVVPTCRGTNPVVAIKPDAKGFIKAGNPFQIWRKEKGAPDVPSPIIHEGIVYLCRENGTLQALDAKTGNEIYSQRLHDSRHRASPVIGDGKIYLSARDGTFNVVKTGRQFELLATNTLPEEFAASPAISQGRIYFRGFKTLYAVSENGK